VYDPEEGRLVVLLGHARPVSKLRVFEADGRVRLVSGGQGSDVRVWDVGEAPPCHGPRPANKR
jgi:hypothetical protein